METTLILAIVAVAVLVIIALIVLGLRRKKAKTVSFEQKATEPKELTQQEKSGNYQAQGGFNFTPAKKEGDVLPGQELKPDGEKLPPQPQVAPLLAEPDQSTPTTQSPATVEPEQATFVEDLDEPDVPVVSVVNTDTTTGDINVVKTPEPTAPTADAETPEETEQALEAAAAAAEIAEAAEQALDQVKTPAVTTEEPAAVVPSTSIDDIDPAAGRIGRLRGRLARSQNVFGKSVLGMLTAGDLDEDAWEDIEAQLIQADLGVKVTMTVVENLRDMIAERGVSNEAEARGMLRECLINACKPELDRSIKAMPYEGKPAVVLMVGVNGTGKTTTTGKLARVLVSMGHKVLLGAADTFRAAAADQLEAWAKRVGAAVVRGKEGADPAAVAFDAVTKGIETGADVVVIDTAGRLHNSANLMDQLGKVKRVVEKKTGVDEVLLVLDATTGQNGLTQARVFGDVVQITGVVLTKLDGTAKGGIVFQVQEDLGVPVKLVGLGEGADDLAPFEVEGFVDALLG